MYKRNLLFLSLVYLFLTCSIAYSMTYQRTDAPEFDLTSIDRIAVVPFKTDEFGLVDGEMIADRLATHLAQEGYLYMVERMQIEKIMSEGDFSREDFSDPVVASKFGKLLGAGAIIIGRVEAKYEEKPGYTNVERWVEVVGSDGKTKTEKRIVQVRTLERVAYVNIDTKAVDVETGKIIASKVAYHNWKQRGVDDKEINALPPQEGIMEDCIGICMDILIRAYTPHKVSISRDLRPRKADDKEKNAIHLAESGLYNDSIKAFEEIINADPSKNDIRGNLAILYEAVGDFEKADYWLEEAVKHGKSAHDLNDYRNSMLKAWYFAEKKNIANKPIVVLDVVNDRIYLDAGTIRQTKVGDRFKICRETVIVHPTTGEKLGSDKRPIALVEVIEVQEKMAIAKVVEVLDSELKIEKLDVAIALEEDGE